MGFGKAFKKAWKQTTSWTEDVGKGLGNLVTGGYIGQREQAKAQARAASSYAAAQEKAAAVQAAQAGTTAIVARQEDNTAGVAEANVDAANKRKRTVASTANRSYSGRVNSLLGLTQGRRTNL